MKDTIEIDVRDIITLAVIIDKFEEFNNEIVMLLRNSNDFDYHKLKRLNNNQKIIGAKKIKEFYEKNSEIIYVINSYSNLYDFVFNNYDFISGKPYEKFVELYNYLLNNKERLNITFNLLAKLGSLSFDRVSFNPDFDFTKNTYQLSAFPYIYEKFYYLDNMYAIPTYDNHIEYKTKGSDYEICLGKGHKDSAFKRNISLRSLFMDPSRLPNYLSKEQTLDEILHLKSDIQNQYDILRETINISVSIENLKYEYKHLYNLVNLCDDMSIKTKMLATLCDLQEDLLELEYLNDNYGKLITNNNNLITEEKLEFEKQQRLQRK